MGRFALPVRHGLTTGELASLFRDRFAIRCDLRVVRLSGWTRGDASRRHGSPVGHSLAQHADAGDRDGLPGRVPGRGTNLSEGRGTTRPFELVGAPFLEGARFADALAQAGMPKGSTAYSFGRPGSGRRFKSMRDALQRRSSPRDRPRQRPAVRDVSRPDPRGAAARAGSRSIGAGSATSSSTNRLAIDLLLGRPDLRPMIEAGAPLADMEALWSEGSRTSSASASAF